ncbi:hypothetical protein CALCODRAFT_275117 [Calocera cornea HHB12733]|uniref:Uncharacterized protein n=1 Tax=Calocera cornea HHB12733 TaxID=1353952 RepID=A0A166JGE2_9BASI|nr:hypothetical protein CALCODRAFT_275117 [Calocera cornea HHB12733]
MRGTKRKRWRPVIRSPSPAPSRTSPPPEERHVSIYGTPTPTAPKRLHPFFVRTAMTRADTGRDLSAPATHTDTFSSSDVHEDSGTSSDEWTTDSQSTTLGGFLVPDGQSTEDGSGTPSD